MHTILLLAGIKTVAAIIVIVIMVFLIATGPEKK